MMAIVAKGDALKPEELQKVMDGAGLTQRGAFVHSRSLYSASTLASKL